MLPGPRTQRVLNQSSAPLRDDVGGRPKLAEFQNAQGSDRWPGPEGNSTETAVL